ncbi:putative mitochondrial hypothetical protein [Leptomonas pyrrhocoris]|uniref:Uncharacterized protein n=1 Tax=Leptomonas pyrrhocoris TaxID=157538 RepID=A0A0M9FPL5_LEPPY|nr:putative mitochondrial hypothetical protein [Leptomonas pyrrhocoris]KPA73329.1 putative mitochondrial hypothetical protein [Leptomonas pyrrhocoris]|eukprot:XP_015651768.1 putative mitochondrial hypothetical protein [Leptomonas pyrrhocoris]
MSEFRSLFLPISEAEQAVFASVFPLLLTVPCFIEGAAASAAGEHHTSSGNPHTHTNAAATAPAATYSPAEGHGSHTDGNASAVAHPSAAEVQAQRGGPPRSLVFAVGSARADALLVVLRSAEVVVFGLDRRHCPPYEFYRMRPLPDTQQLQDARKSKSKSSEAAEATCASLLPLSISYCCRIAVPSEGSGGDDGRGGTGGHRNAEETAKGDEIFIRGLVGSSDGRVSLFSDVAYTFSFAAHEVAVAQVDAVLLPPCSLSPPSANEASNTNGHRNGSPFRSSSAEPVTFATNGRVREVPAPQQQGRDNLQRAMQRLGIVSSGTDGVIMLWRCIDGSMSPTVLLRFSSFGRRVPYTTYHPSALSALFSVTAPQSSREAAIDAELCCPPSCLVHPTSLHAHGVRVRQFASLATSVPSPSSASSESNEKAAGLAEAARHAAPTWLRLPMPGSWTTAVTAMATHNGITLVAREASLFSMVRFNAQAAVRLWKAESSITQIVLQDTLALAVCARTGAVHVLTIHPVTGRGVHQRTFYSYKNRRILHVSLHEASLLMSIVDVCGSTELVQLPSDVLLRRHAHPLQGGYTLGSAERLNLLASMAALQVKVSIEDVKGADAKAGAGEEATSMYEANAALDQLNEHLLLARLAVPEECDRYMTPNHHVF